MPLLTELEGCSGGHVLRESSVRSAMFIADEPQNAVQAPSGAACLWFNAGPQEAPVAFISRPLLTELVSNEGGFCYKHGAPNGALSPLRTRIGDIQFL
jgi:hypothetical protein